MSEPSRKPWLWLAIGGVLWSLSNGNWAIPAAPWLALPLLLRFSRTRLSWPGLVPLLAVLVAADIAILWPMLSLDMVPPTLRLAAGFAWGMVAFLPFAADRALRRRWRGLPSTLAFPMAFAVLEWLYSLTPDGSWGSLAYTQFGALPLLQLGAVTGPWGITFLISWFAAVANLAWQHDFSLSRTCRAAAVLSAVIALVLVFGGARLAIFRPDSSWIDVATVSDPPDFPTYFDMADRRGPFAEERQHWQRLFAMSAEAAVAGAKLVVWQEYAVFLNEGAEGRFLEDAGQAARVAGIHLVVAYGLKPAQDEHEPWRNRLAWIGPDGRVLGRYGKAHPSAALEADIVPGGTPPLVVDTAWGRIAAVICTDQDFPGLIRNAGEAGAGLLVVPSAAWPQVVPLHTHMAVFRAIENGFSLLKATGGGQSAAFDPLGRVLARRDQPGMMLVRLPILKMETPYTWWGDAFAVACLAGLILLAAWRRPDAAR